MAADIKPHLHNVLNDITSDPSDPHKDAKVIALYNELFKHKKAFSMNHWLGKFRRNKLSAYQSLSDDPINNDNECAKWLGGLESISGEGELDEKKAKLETLVRHTVRISKPNILQRLFSFMRPYSIFRKFTPKRLEAIFAPALAAANEKIAALAAENAALKRGATNATELVDVCDRLTEANRLLQTTMDQLKQERDTERDNLAAANTELNVFRSLNSSTASTDAVAEVARLTGALAAAELEVTQVAEQLREQKEAQQATTEKLQADVNRLQDEARASASALNELDDLTQERDRLGEELATVRAELAALQASKAVVPAVPAAAAPPPPPPPPPAFSGAGAGAPPPPPPAPSMDGAGAPAPGRPTGAAAVFAQILSGKSQLKQTKTVDKSVPQLPGTEDASTSTPVAEGGLAAAAAAAAKKRQSTDGLSIEEQQAKRRAAAAEKRREGGDLRGTLRRKSMQPSADASTSAPATPARQQPAADSVSAPASTVKAETYATVTATTPMASPQKPVIAPKPSASPRELPLTPRRSRKGQGTTPPPKPARKPVTTDTITTTAAPPATTTTMMSALAKRMGPPSPTPESHDPLAVSDGWGLESSVTDVVTTQLEAERQRREAEQARQAAAQAVHAAAMAAAPSAPAAVQASASSIGLTPAEMIQQRRAAISDSVAGDPLAESGWGSTAPLAPPSARYAAGERPTDEYSGSESDSEEGDDNEDRNAAARAAYLAMRVRASQANRKKPTGLSESSDSFVFVNDDDDDIIAAMTAKP